MGLKIYQHTILSYFTHYTMFHVDKQIYHYNRPVLPVPPIGTLECKTPPETHPARRLPAGRTRSSHDFFWCREASWSFFCDGRSLSEGQEIKLFDCTPSLKLYHKVFAVVEAVLKFLKCDAVCIRQLTHCLHSHLCG